MGLQGLPHDALVLPQQRPRLGVSEAVGERSEPSTSVNITVRV